MRLVSYRPGRIEFEPAPDAPGDLAQRLGQSLGRWTGARWGVSVTRDGGRPAIREAREAVENERRAAAAEDPAVQAVLSAFPAARIKALRTPEDIAAEAASQALPEIDDDGGEDWDPFEG